MTFVITYNGLSRGLLGLARRSCQSILKEIKPVYPLEGLMLKLQYFGHFMRRADSLEKTLMLGKIKGKRRREPERMRWLDNIADSMDLEFEQTPGDSEGKKSLESTGLQRVGPELATEKQQNTRL